MVVSFVLLALQMWSSNKGDVYTTRVENSAVMLTLIRRHLKQFPDVQLLIRWAVEDVKKIMFVLSCWHLSANHYIYSVGAVYKRCKCKRSRRYPWPQRWAKIQVPPIDHAGLPTAGQRSSARCVNNNKKSVFLVKWDFVEKVQYLWV